MTTPQLEQSALIELYDRLARAHEQEPTVPDHGGGVPGDRYPLDGPTWPSVTSYASWTFVVVMGILSGLAVLVMALAD